MQIKFFPYLLAFAVVVLLGSTAQAQRRFVAALTPQQTVPTANSPARGSCTINLDETGQTPTIHFTCSFSGLSSGVISGHIHGGAAPGQNGDISLNFNLTTNQTSGIFFPFEAINITPALAADIRAKRAYIDLHTANFPNGELRGQIKTVTIDFDFDGDGRTDPIVFRQSNGFAYTLRSVNNSFSAQQLLAQASDLPVGADFDGDGLAELGVVRVDQATGAATTIYTRSRDGAQRQIQWGNAALLDLPAPGDYDGDGIIDIAVFRRSNGVWYILQSSNNLPRYEFWGQANTDFPCPGDYDRDSKTDVCVNRVEGGQLVWYIRRSSDNQIRRTVWGLSSDSFFAANPVDVDGDGATDIMVSRITNGQVFYYALRSSDNSFFGLQWGLESDGVRLGDYDGDNKTDFGALRSINNQLVWFIRQSSDGQTRVFNWGLPGDR
jgi:hypothetical protein